MQENSSICEPYALKSEWRCYHEWSFLLDTISSAGGMPILLSEKFQKNLPLSDIVPYEA